MIYLRVWFFLLATSVVSAFLAAQTQAAAQAPTQSAVAADCAKPHAALPSGTTRIYIALRNGADGSGKSAADARDGSTVELFDSILRCYAEGCRNESSPNKSVPKTEKLTVCLGPGVFQTKGNYDFLINTPHPSQQGFTLGKGWKVHGSGVAQTTVQLSAYRPITDPKNIELFPAGTGTGVVFSTNSDAASGIEISDLTIDANYPKLKAMARQQGVRALNLEAIHLRANEGGHWIHNINVINTSGEIGGMDERFETFPV